MKVYDFDNTIYNGESSVDFFFFCVRKKPVLLRLLPLLVIKLIKYKMCLISVDELERYVAKYAMSVINEVGDIEQISKDFLEKYFNKIKSFYFSQKSDNDLILSANADFLIKGFSQKLGGIKYICSEVDLKTGEIKQLCFRENKTVLFKKKYPDEKISEFYTDSLNDMPIIEMSEKAFLVRGNKIKQIK